MKKFISGFLVGALIFSMLGIFAASYVANPLDYKVMVNGKEFTSDPPPLEVEGRTYLPLRAMGDALGVPVNWNEKLRQAEVGNCEDSHISNYITYSEKPWCPDFGKYMGIKVDFDSVEDDGSHMYVYSSIGITSDEINNYCNIFTAKGFQKEIEGDVIAMASADRSHMLAISYASSGKYIIVLVY